MLNTATLEKCKLKPQWDTTAHPPEKLKSKKPTIPATGEQMELKLTVLGEGVINDAALLENRVPWKVKHRITPRYILKRNENRCPNKNLYKNVHSSIIHVSPQVKTTQMFITKEWIQHIFKIHWMENYLAIKWNKVYLNVENIMLTEISQTQNATYCTNSIYMKCSE